MPNRLRRAGKSFKDFEDHTTQYLTYAGTMAKSSNIGTILAAERMGNLERLYPYLQRFGIGQPTGLGLPGEASGSLLRAGATGRRPPATRSTFGQGYSVNTVQMASAIGAVAQRRRARDARGWCGSTTTAGGKVVAPAGPDSGRGS